MQAGMQFWPLVAVGGPVRGDGAGAFCEIDGRVRGGMQFGMLFGVLLEVLVIARAHFCEIDGRVLFGALFGGCCWRCWCTIVGMFFAIWGLAGVFAFVCLWL